MKSILRLTLLIYTLSLLLLLLMQGLGQIAPNRGIIAYSQIDELQDPHVLLLDVPSGNKLGITGAIAENVLGRQPQWSRDGSRLSFWAYHNREASYAYEIQLPQYQLVNLNERWPYFSLPLYGANGLLAFANNPTYANSPLYLIDENAESATTILENVLAPQFSPDGRTLAYLTFYDPETEETLSEEETADIRFEIDLFTLNLQTGEHRNWTLNLSSSGFPQFSPDSRYIAFASRLRNIGLIYLLDLQEESLMPLPVQTAALSSPQWSANGRYLAFATSRWNDLEIAVLDLQDMSIRNVSNHPLYDVQPTWSGDSRLAFVSRRMGQDEIFSYDLATNQLERLTFSLMNEADPVWRPR